MKFKQNLLSHAVRLGLVAAAAGALGLTAAPSVSAQEPDEAAVLDRIQVTGTRIRSQTITASAPVAEIEREEFQFSGATRVDDLVNQYPQMAPYFDSFANNPSVGYPTADLRGLGSNRTLALVNGRRLPPGDVVGSTDISMIPSALVQRVDILTGGASAVYGSDAMAGVVNFVLDTEFEGFSANFGWNAYQHRNNNDYLPTLMDAQGFDYPTGNSGFDGRSKNVDIAIGSRFADGAGHAMAWVTWRENDPLFQGERDYSSCALNAAGTACGGSATAANPNFFVLDSTFDFVGFAHLLPNGRWAPGIGELYNFAPINYYQRPEERRTFGASIRYEVNPHFRPYVETMYVDRRNSVQIAESGTFFINLLELECTDPLLGTMCADLGLSTDGPVEVYVGKRNVEGGPRFFGQSNDAYRFVLGTEGELFGGWSYDVSLLYGHNAAVSVGQNDLLADRVEAALLGCPAGSFAGCVPYNVWVPGGVTSDQAAALTGTSMQKIDTAQTVANAYVTGDLGFGLPWAGANTMSLVAGFEWRKDEYDRITDTNTAEGNFTGSGGPTQALSGVIKVSELFLESSLPILADAGFVDYLSLDLGYRYSDYDLSGSANTYKLGFGMDMGNYRMRGGYNRAIRAPNVSELFLAQGAALWNGADPCSGATPQFTAAQCANTGVTAAQYGRIQASPAAQYNQLIGGNLDLRPEVGDTYTLGFVAAPIEGLQLSVDYFDIKIEDTIGTIGASTILQFCGITGDPFLCDRVNRNPSTGDLWLGSDLTNAGHIVNLTDNFGELRFRGLDFTGSYRWDVLGGRLTTSFMGTRTLKNETTPLPGVNDEATYDCKGVINISCLTPSPKWRHIANARFTRDFYTVNLRWRHIGSLDYRNTDGSAGTTDQLLVGRGGGIGSYNYLDLSGSVFIGQNMELTLGVNNIADKEPPMVGSTLALNGNSPGAYDQAGRYVFASFGVTF